MNVEEVMKKLEEIKVELYNNVTSSEDKSPIQVETQDRLPIDEDLAGEEIKIERTKGEKVKDRGNMSRSSPQDGSKNPDKDYVFGKNAPSIGELQNQLDGLFKESNLPEQVKKAPMKDFEWRKGRREDEGLNNPATPRAENMTLDEALAEMTDKSGSLQPYKDEYADMLKELIEAVNEINADDNRPRDSEGYYY